ncbi:MAG: DUF4276 family protein [Sumerlaeia bacterium]
MHLHFEFLVEDQSGKLLLESLIPQIVAKPNTSNIISYKGVGNIPTDLRATTDPSKRILLNNLPRLLKGYGKTYAKTGDFKGVVVIVCDLDRRCFKEFRQDIRNLIQNVPQAPETVLCLAIEEMEAWILGDLVAILRVFPKAKQNILNTYVNDSICGTWEKLADAVYKGGSEALMKDVSSAKGREKCAWAKKIGPLMNVDSNRSPSFCYFRDKIRKVQSQLGA